MLFRFLYLLAALALCAVVIGCSETVGGQTEEEKNPFFVTGQDLAAAHDFKRALHAFEKALEINPDSALAHYELGLINEQHENDYVSAIYHYRRALRLRPDSYPADNAKVRIASCKQELVKAELVAPVAQSMVRELERLKQENGQLRQQVENLQASLRPRPPEPKARPGERTRDPQPPRPSPGGRTPLSPSSPTSGVSSHLVHRGETAFSIARAHRISVSALLSANPGLNPRELRAGQRLQIPSR